MLHRHVQILDAAIRVLGTSGARHLTHRSVDKEARLPAGSTSNVFRSRDALLEGVLGRILERDITAWNRLARETAFDIDSFAAVAGGMIAELASKDRVFALARFAVFVEAGLHDELNERIDENYQNLAAWATPLLAALGSATPRAHLQLVMSYLDGLLINQLVRSSPDFDPATAIATFLRAVLRPVDPTTGLDIGPVGEANA